MGEIVKTLYDGGGWLSECKSASLREENRNVEPTYFRWIRGDAGHEFVSDGEIRRILKYYKETGVTESGSVAWLIEPRELHPENYEFDFSPFRAILTYDKELLEKYPDKAKFYPLGGSSIHIDKWGMCPKTKDICMILSDKKTTEGHKLRHKIAEEFGDRIDLYGAGVGKPFESKFEVLKDYKFCIVVESCRSDYYFTEKLIDAISVGCIPVYNGAICADPTDKPQFDMYNFLDFSHLNSLLEHSFFVYPSTDMGFLARNLEEAKKYRIAEDWIYENYGDLFHD